MGYRVALIGAGIIAEWHLEALKRFDRLRAVAVADVREERANEAADRYGLKAYTDYREMIEEETPDIAVIALPHFLHKEAAIWCADRKCHILLEKPMALNIEECEDIIRATRANGVRLMVGHTQHYKPENRKAKELIDLRSMGRLVMINAVRHLHYYNSERPEWFFEKRKSGGGILMNFGAHSVDMIQWLTGSRVTKVKASVSYFGTKGDIEGSGLVFLETSKGIPATISQSGYLGAAKDETEFIFTNGMMKLVSGQGLWISDGDEYRGVSIEGRTDPFVLQFRDLLESIEGARKPECSGEYARTVISAIQCMYRSHETGVELPVPHGGECD
jgi:predicted dehydrogenase